MVKVKLQHAVYMLIFFLNAFSFGMEDEKNKKEREDPRILWLEGDNKLQRAQSLFELISNHDSNECQIEELLKTGVDINQVNSKGDTPLSVAMSLRRYGIVSLLIKAGANCNVLVQGVTPLIMVAAQGFGFEQLVKLLIEHKVDIDARSVTGVTALMCASHGCCAEIVKLLLEKGASVNAQDRYGRTALFFASGSHQTYHCRVVDMLLKAGANPNLTCNAQNLRNSTALVIAILKKREDIIQRLLDAHADPNHNFVLVEGGKEQKLTPLTIALMSKSWEIVDRLILAGAAINKLSEVIDLLFQADVDISRLSINSQRALMIAAIDRGYETIKLFVAKGADYNVGTEKFSPAKTLASQLRIKSLSPLQYAFLNKRYEIMDLFLSKEGSIHARDINGQTPLLLAMPVADEELLSFLLKKGIDLNEGGDAYLRGVTALMLAAFYNNKDALNFLIKNKAYADTTDRNGRTALMWAIEARNEEMAKLLLEAGANVNRKDNRGCTALHYAAFGIKINDTKCKELVELLLRYNANVNEQCGYGTTILMIAADRGFKETIKFLIQSGANVHLIDNNGSSALLKAVKNSYEIVESLIAQGARVNDHSDNGCTPLIACCTKSDRPFMSKRLAELIINAGADVNYSNFSQVDGEAGRPALAVAYDGPLVALLIKHGADATKRIGTKTIFQVAKDTNRPPETLQLLELCAQPEFAKLRENPKLYVQTLEKKIKRECLGKDHSLCSHQTMLMWLCMIGYADAINELFKSEIPFWYLNAQDKEGKTALMHSIIYVNDDAVVKILSQQYEKEFNKLYNLMRSTESDAEHTKVQALFDKAKRAINVRDTQGKSALTYALESGNFNRVNRLCQAGARPTMKEIKIAAEDNNPLTLGLFILNGSIQPSVTGEVKKEQI